jgi:3-dehydroquinate synthase
MPKHNPDVLVQKMRVPFEYPVCFTRDVFAAENPLFADTLDRLKEGRRHRAVVYVDGGAAAAHPDLLRRIREYFHAHRERLELAGPPEVLPGGEEAKTGWAAVRDIMTRVGNEHLCRQSFVVAVGGGSVLDMVGFAASLVHRGLRLVRVPTTVLGQNDAGVGVKNGMNEHGMKNFVGTFAPPFAVLNDFSFLPTLADREWIGGVAEAFKVAIIRDGAFFYFLCGKAAAIRGRDMGAMETLVRRCAKLHLDHIRTAGDPFELGSARPLDFGHWAGHKLESLSDYRLGHGQAAALGIALDSDYAARRGMLTPDECEQILDGMASCGLPLWDPLLEQRRADGTLAVLAGLEEFREHLGGSLTVTLPQGIGAKVEVNTMNPDLLEQGVRALKERHDAAGG